MRGTSHAPLHQSACCTVRKARYGKVQQVGTTTKPLFGHPGLVDIKSLLGNFLMEPMVYYGKAKSKQIPKRGLLGMPHCPPGGSQLCQGHCVDLERKCDGIQSRRSILVPLQRWRMIFIASRECEIHLGPRNCWFSNIKYWHCSCFWGPYWGYLI